MILDLVPCPISGGHFIDIAMDAGGEHLGVIKLMMLEVYQNIRALRDLFRALHEMRDQL